MPRPRPAVVPEFPREIARRVIAGPRVTFAERHPIAAARAGSIVQRIACRLPAPWASL